MHPSKYLDETGARLKLRPVVICTALVYLQRFQAANALVVAAAGVETMLEYAQACLFLACKVEESGIHIEALLEESNKVFPNIAAAALQERREILIKREEQVLKEIEFNLVVEHAQPLAFGFIQKLPSGLDLSRDALVKHSYSILQDFLASSISGGGGGDEGASRREKRYIDVPPALLAASAVSLAIKFQSFVEGKEQLARASGADFDNLDPMQILALEHDMMQIFQKTAAV